MPETRHRAWQVDAFGEPEQMTLRDVPLPDPGPGQVRIRNRAAGLNFFDLLLIQGKYQARPAFPFTPGSEVAGVVDGVGAGVGGLAPGDRVAAFVEGGSYGEYSVAPAARTARLPEAVDFTPAACLLVYQTSYLALRTRASLQASEWLLVHAGASGVGMAAIQLGRVLDARVIATAGSREKLDFCLAQGAAHALESSDPSWVDRVKQITGGRGADVIYDPVGGDIFDLSTKCIAGEGRLLVVGFASGRIPSLAANRLLLKDFSAVGVYWGGYSARHPDYAAATHRELVEMLRDGRIRPVISKTYGLPEAPAGLRALAERRVLGKAVLLWR